MKKDVIIIGAGLSGLSAAIHLQNEGREVFIIEATERVGGRIKTDIHEGFRLDRGFQVLLTAYPEAKKILDYEALNLQKMLPGANVIYDGVGKNTFDEGLLALRRRGTLAVFGAASGQVAPIEIMKISSGSIFLTRPTLADYVAERSELLWRANEVFETYRRGDMQVAIGGRFPLSDAASAHIELEARRTTGKLILQVR
jgi:NADPH:quinone reductase-like Zn-dependent oxidoreductase